MDYKPSVVMKTVETNEEAIAPWLKIIQRQVASLKFGVVQIVVHDGHVTQIERTEKFRLNQSPNDISPRVTG